MPTGNDDVARFKSPPPETEDNRMFAEGAPEDEMTDEQRADKASSEAEAAHIRKIERRVEFPEALAYEVDRWDGIREYVHTDAMLLDDEEAVGTNFIYRNQDALMALIAPKDPAADIQPREWMEPEIAPPMGNPLMDAANPMSDSRLPGQMPQEITKYARTHKLLVDRQQDASGLVSIVEGAAQDAITLPISWIKMRVQEDFEKDATGYGRNNDQLDSLARYERLSMDYENGIFTDRSPEFQELKILSDTLKAYVLGGLQAQIDEAQQLMVDDMTGQAVLDNQDDPVYTGAEDLQAQAQALIDDPEVLVQMSQLPEVAHYIGFTFQQVDPEDIRWDWNIRRPEDLRYARWMAHRAWMTEADIREKWGATQEQLRTAARFSQDGYKVTLKDSADDDPEYGGKDPEEYSKGDSNANDDDFRRGETLAVWEYWDRVQGRVFRFVQGTGAYLDSYVPTALSGRFFPFFPITYNRVTGRYLGICDTDLQAPLQDESNRMRTWQREAQKSAHPRWMIAKGLLRPGEKQRFEDALPYSITEAERAEDLAKSIFPIIPPDYNSALHDRSDTIMEMQQMAGIPAAALGSGNLGMTATSDSITNQQLGNQVGRRRKMLEKVYQEIYQAMMEINAQIMPEENVKALVGPGAVWPEVDRQTILTNFAIEVESTLDDEQRRGNELKAWIDFATLAQNFGLPLDPIPLAKKLLSLMGIRVNLANYISIPALLQMLQQGGAMPGPAVQQGSAAGAPEQQGAKGQEGGAPPGEGFGAPPTPEELPGP